MAFCSMFSLSYHVVSICLLAYKDFMFTLSSIDSHFLYLYSNSASSLFMETGQAA